MKKKLHGFSYVKNMANFVAFRWSLNFSSSTNLQIVRSKTVVHLLEGMLVGGDDISHKHNAANGVQANMNPEKKTMNQQRK